MDYRGADSEEEKRGQMFHDSANLRKLAIDVIMSALKDLLFGNPLEQVMALEFLASEDVHFWGDIGNVDARLEEVLKQPERIREILIEEKNKNKPKTVEKKVLPKTKKTKTTKKRKTE